MANWVFNAKQDLRDYEALKNSLTTIPDQIAELEQKITTLKAATYDKTPVQGGSSGREDRLMDYIDRKERLKRNYEVANLKVERIESGLETLSDLEYKVLNYRYIKGMNVRDVCSAIGYEESRVHEIKRTALRKFTLAMYGIIDY